MNSLLPPKTSIAPYEPSNRATPAAPLPPVPEVAPLDIARLFGIIRRRWLLVGTLTLGAAVLAWDIVRKEPALYQATAVIQLVDAREELTGGLVDANGRGQPINTTALSEVEVLTSRAVASEVVDSEPLGTRVQTVGFPTRLLSRVAVEDGAPPATISVAFAPEGVVVGTSSQATPYGDPLNVGGIQFAVARPPSDLKSGEIVVYPRDLAAEIVRASLDATPRKQTNIIVVTYTTDDPIVAQHVVNRAVRAYQRANARLAQQRSRQRRQFIEEQLAKNDAQLSEAERALSEFRGQQQAYSARDKFAAQQSGLFDIEMRRQDLVAERQIVAGVLKRITSDDPATRHAAVRLLASMQAFAGNPAISQLNERLVGYEAQRAELTSGPNGRAATHPDVLRLDTLIVQGEQAITQAASAQVALLDARIESLDELRARKTSALQQYPAAEAEETRLSQNADALRDQGTLLRNEYQQARIAEAAEVGQVEIVDPATRARPLPTTTVRVIFIALLLGFVGGSFLAIGIETANRTIRSRGEIESALRVPVLATIPRIESAKSTKSPNGFASLGTNLRHAEQLQRQAVALSSAAQWRSPTTEAYRHLRTGLFYARNGARPRQVVVTSPGEAEGKTSVAVNLAITLAVQRQRVLLVDCDLYKSRLATVFDLPQSPGLCEVILEGVAPRDAIHPSSVSGLFVMPAGVAPVTPEDTIGSPRMAALLNELGREFDIIILDCPPVLALPDSAILSSAADAVVLVVRAGRTKRAGLNEALRELTTVGAQVAGVVLNDPDGHTRKVGGYYYEYARG